MDKLLSAAVRRLQRLPSPVVAYARDFEDGDALPAHRHPRAQLLHTLSGVMEVDTQDDTWVVPAHRALWVPSGVRHGIRMIGRVRMRTIYVKPAAARVLAERSRAVAVTPLLRELILRAIELQATAAEARLRDMVTALILEELRLLPVEPLTLPMPSEPRLRALAEALMQDPTDRRDAAEIAKAAGSSTRTLTRRFAAETGMTLGAWRRQARLLSALRLLAEGRKITSVALDLGYENPSAFGEAFRQAFGTTPGRYFRDSNQATD